MQANAYFCLLRHGEAEGGAKYRGVTDDRLTDRGWDQMWGVAGDATPYDIVLTSPLVRCADFAHAFARHRRLPLAIDSRWRELDFGAWEGRTANEILQTEPGAFERFLRDPWNNHPPGGEPLHAMQARVLAAWKEVVARGCSVLLVTHGGPIRIVLCHVFGIAPTELLHIQVAHASMHRLVPLIAQAAVAVSTR